MSEWRKTEAMARAGFLCLTGRLIKSFMGHITQAQEATTQKPRLILAPALLYLNQMGQLTASLQYGG